MKNEQNITLEMLKAICTPALHDSYDKISNLSDQFVGTYAYLLQESLVGIMTSKIDAALENEYSMVKEPLKKLVLPMLGLTIEYLTTEIKDFRKRTENSFDIIELSFRVVVGSVGYPVVLRSGFLLMMINQAGITDLDELKYYNAVIIYNQLAVNPGICAFMAFEKRPKDF